MGRTTSCFTEGTLSAVRCFAHENLAFIRVCGARAVCGAQRSVKEEKLTKGGEDLLSEEKTTHCVIHVIYVSFGGCRGYRGCTPVCKVGHCVSRDAAGTVG